MLRRRVGLALALTLVLMAPAAASAQQTVTLRASLTPERLGASTTLGFSFAIAGTHGQLPSPLTELQLNYPTDFGFGVSGLGLATCTSHSLVALGLEGCSAESLMGLGSASVAIPVGPRVVREQTAIAIVRAPTQQGRLALIFYAEGVSPIAAQLTLPAALFEAQAPFGGRVDVELPLIPSVPEAPDVSIVRMDTTLGPQHLIYYERVGRRQVPYRPRGIRLPRHCPRGGFPFEASFGFLDGTHTTAHATVACPRAQAAAGPRGPRHRAPSPPLRRAGR